MNSVSTYTSKQILKIANCVQGAIFGQALLDLRLLGPLDYYTQYPFIRNALIRNNAEISGNFKKPAFKGSNLRNALK